MSKSLQFLISLFTAWLPVFALQKPVFLFYHHALAKGYGARDFCDVAWHGLKLDCTLAGYLTALPLLLLLVAVWKPGSWLRKSLNVYLLVAALAVAAIFALDVALYAVKRPSSI